jgi:hypothetical protein
MANWDHLSNIGTHPVLDPDPAVRRPHILAAADREIRKFTDIREREVGLQGRTVTVTIGRNVGDVPMSEPAWLRFRDYVRLWLQSALLPDFLATYDGTGEWQGVPEDSTTIVLSGVSTCVQRADLQVWLAATAAIHGQDAIALTIGDTELVES